MAVNAHWTGIVTADQGFTTEGGINYGLDTGVADAYIVNLTPAVASLTDGMLLSFTAANANATDAPTITVNGITKNVVTQDGFPLSLNDFSGFTPSFLMFSESQDYWMLLNASVSNVQANYLQNALYYSGTDAGAANAYDVTLDFGGWVGGFSPGVGSQVSFFPANNNSGASTLRVNGQGPTTITLMNGQALPASAMLTTKQAWLMFGVNYAGSIGWILMNPQGGAGGFGNISISGNTIISTNTNGNIGLTPNGNGGTLIGTQTAITGLAYSLQIATANQVPLLVLGSYRNTNGGFQERFYKSRSTTIGSFSAVSSGDQLGQMQFYGDDGAAFRQAVNITATAQGSISSGIVPGQLVIQTANTSGTLTTALTISNDQTATFASTATANALVSSTTVNAGGAIQSTGSSVIAGSNGTGGSLVSYSPGSSLGTLSITSANNGANYANVLTNASTSAARTWTLPDASGTLALVSSGTFAPNLQFGGANVGITYTAQVGAWQRVGNVITVQIGIILSNKGSSTGSATISNLPAAASDNAQVTFLSTPLVTYPAGAMIVGAPNTSAVLGMYSVVSGGGQVALDDTQFSNTSQIFANFSYFV